MTLPGKLLWLPGEWWLSRGANRIQCQELTFNLKNNKGSFKGEVIVTRDETEIRSSFMEGDFDANYLFKEGVEKERKEEEERLPLYSGRLLFFTITEIPKRRGVKKGQRLSGRKPK